MPLRSLALMLASSVLPLCAAPAQTPAPPTPAPVAGEVVVVEVGRYAFVTNGQISYLSDSLDAAVAAGAAAVVLRIDCPGGFASEARRFVERLRALGLPTVAWVEGRAAGAGALAALATDKVYLKPGQFIGGEIEAINWRGPKEELPNRLVELSYWNIYEDVAPLLAAVDVPGEVVAALGDVSKELRVGGKKYSDAGDVLSIDQDVGAELGLVDGSAEDLDALLAAAGIAAPVRQLPAPEVVILLPLVREPPSGGEPETAEPAESVATAEREGEGTGDSMGDEAEDEQGRAFGETKLEKYTGKIVVIPVEMESLLRKTKFDFMKRVVAKADAEGATAVIFDLNTPGGVGWYTEEVMLKSLQNLTVPTYSFVNPKAVSAGALLAISTDYIYMHPPSTMGSAAPIMAGGQDLQETLYKKVIEDIDKTADAAARIKGYNRDIVRAFIRSEATVSITAPVVTPSGSLAQVDVLINNDEDLLSLNDAEATEIVDGRRIFATGTARSIEDLVEQAGLTGAIVVAKPLGFEAVADWLVKLAPWLLLFGIVGAYIEFKAPGFGIPGAISLICFGLFFFGHQTAGYLAGYEAIGIFVLGIVLIILEIFVFPGLLIFGALGLVMVFGSLIYAMVDPLDFGWDGKLNWSNLAEVLSGPAVNLVTALVGAAILILLAIRYLPSTPVLRWLILESGLAKGTGLKFAGEAGMLAEAPTDDGSDVPALVGQRGVTETALRPAGAARIAGERLDVVSSGEFIESGTPVKVVEFAGSRIVVEAVEEG